MGYYTQFSMKITTEDDNILKIGSPLYNEVANVFASLLTSHYEASEDDFKSEEEFLYLMNTSSEEAKWYCYLEDMKALAKRFPSLKFELEGKGEARQDWWIAQFWGDKMAKFDATIIPPDPNLF